MAGKKYSFKDVDLGVVRLNRSGNPDAALASESMNRGKSEAAYVMFGR